MSRMTYMRSWKSLWLTSHTWLGLNPQIGRPLSRIVVPLVYVYFTRVISTRSDFDTHECDNDIHECHYDTHECDYNTHECDFNTHKIDFCTQSTFSTSRVWFYTQSVVSTHTRVILRRMRVNMTLTNWL
jgi:hypothetical protein